PATVKRAERALFCSPFYLELFADMQNNSVKLQKIADFSTTGQKYLKKPLSENKIDTELMWLTKVGLLRREVDGQGITDSFRLTPLGRILVNKWSHQGGAFPVASFSEQIANWFLRCFNFSF
ncbi:MAG: hypothetical protein D6756_03140, partial [Cyanobacteria bacterium J083]